MKDGLEELETMEETMEPDRDLVGGGYGTAASRPRKRILKMNLSGQIRR